MYRNLLHGGFPLEEEKPFNQSSRPQSQFFGLDFGFQRCPKKHQVLNLQARLLRDLWLKAFKF